MNYCYKTGCQCVYATVNGYCLLTTCANQGQLNKELKQQTSEQIIKRLWAVLVRDGEQFIAGEIRKIAEENGIEVGE